MTESEFNTFFDQTYGYAMHLAGQVHHNVDDAEQVVLDCFVDIWQKLDRFKTIDEAGRYYLKMLIHRRNAYQRRINRATLPVAVERFSEIPDDRQPLEKDPRLDGIMAQFRHLSEMKRFVLSLFLKGRETKEIAGILGISTTTVRNVKMQAIEQLRNRLKVNSL